MKCPKCGSQQDRVVDSRPLKDGAAIRRRRECIDCSYRFTTYEEVEGEDLRVQKRDGRYEPFDRRKLMTGLEKACEKRPVSRETIEKAVDTIVEDLRRKFNDEIPTTAIGEAMMHHLREIDEVAYVRFASVYKKFRDIKEFVSTVESLDDL
ncbi:MAG TPA: transcriptional regulator NrdR [Candidatus Methylacidiphilales bacterium]